MDKIYHIKFATTAEKDIRKIDKGIVRLVFSWLMKNVEGCNNPRLYGKALIDKNDVGGKNLREKWKFRIGDIRVICNINDDTIRV